MGHVLLIEAGPHGPSFPGHFWTDSTNKFRSPHPRYWWRWKERVAEFQLLSGKVVGGTSAVNGMYYMQGHHEDYPVPPGDIKAALEALGVPKLRRMLGFANLPPAFRALVDAFAAAGVPWVASHSSFPVKQGLGFVARWAVRRSSFSEALDPNQNTTGAFGRLGVLSGSRVRRLLWNDAAPEPSVRGIEVLSTRNRTVQIPTKRVVLAAGAIGTPSLLLASGARKRCKAPVGVDLQEHFGFRSVFALRRAPCSTSGDPGDDGAWAVSIARTVGSHLVAFLGSGRPDVQVVLEPLCCETSGVIALCFYVEIIVLRGFSRGFVTMDEVNPDDPNSDKAPAMTFRLHMTDVKTLADTLDFLRTRVFNSSALENWSPQLLGTFPAVGDEDALIAYIMPRLRNLNHPAGTTSRALDERFRLRGCRGVWVADASAFHSPISGSPDVPTRALGRVAATYLLEDEDL